MKFYESWLQEQQFKTTYIESQQMENDCRILTAMLARDGAEEIHIAGVTDQWLMKRMQQSCKKHRIQLHIYLTPNFITNLKDADDFFRKKKNYFQTGFYVWQRKQRNILLNADGNPEGGKWTFDADNRQRFPKNSVPPPLIRPDKNKFINDAIPYVEKHFGSNYGNISTLPLFAVTFDDAEKWLDDFLKKRFKDFGVYEDAIVAGENVLHHSVITPMLNTGLLNPQQIIASSIDFAKHNNIPLNSLEGFIRQVMGWREFIRIVYEREGSKQRTTNYWKFKRKIPESFWKGTTGILPVDITIKKVLETGYCHHIERLMVLGNFMLLCEFDPNEVYRWFMELFIDAYDWVMVPNVYGMTQFADGGLMVTKPYISGSNYLLKMSDYQKGGWQQIWDGLFWRFLHVHQSFFLTNPRLRMLLKTFDKMDEQKRKVHLENAQNYLHKLDLETAN